MSQDSNTPPHEVHVFGDSHWRVFFPFVNHGEPGLTFESNGIRVIDMVGNGLSGATMHGLLNDRSRHDARRRIMASLDALGGVENAALTFGEVDVRYHNARYFTEEGRLDELAVLGLLMRFKEFVEVDLFRAGRVRSNLFIYYGFSYPMGPATHLHPEVTLGEEGFARATLLHEVMGRKLPEILCFTMNGVHVMINPHAASMVSDDGVHLLPERTYPMISSYMRGVLG